MEKDTTVLVEQPKKRITGEYIICTTAEKPFRAFLPYAMPPEPPVQTGDFEDMQANASQALGGLNAITKFLPDKHLFLYSYIRKEALLSSQIEGTQSSISDLLLYENKDVPGVPIDDVQEVSCYVRALEHGIEKIREGFPISLRLIKEMHRELLSSGRGRTKSPGEFRRVQVRIGGTNETNARFVPPPPVELDRLMGELEKFINDVPKRTPTLLKAALAHVQFETIHPFLDGNGRLGRLLISLIFASEKMLEEPLLYLSLYFKTNREQYYDQLQNVRTDGDWEAWYGFFLKGVAEVANGASATAHRLLQMFESDHKLLEARGRDAGSPVRVHDLLKHSVILSASDVVDKIDMSFPTAQKALSVMQNLGIVHEITGQKRYTKYAYTKYLAILNEGAEPL